MEPCDLLCPGQVSRPCRACLRRHRPPGNWGGTAGGASGLPSREDGRFYVFGDRGGRDMIVVMGPGHTRPQLDAVIAKIEEAGLRGRILVEARETTGLPIVTEAMDARQLEMVVKYADMVQIGARNMQNYTLLRDAGRAGHPVMLKRGPSATIEEWLLAAEYIMAEGNP